MRLIDYLIDKGYKDAKSLILSHKVKVNGHTIFVLETLVNDSDSVEVNL